MESVTLDALDLRLLHALQLDGRAPFSKIATVLDVSDRTVARRFGKLRSAGIARVAGVTNSHRLGHAEWLVRLRVPPARSTALARALAHRPDTAWVAVLSSGTEVGCVFRVAGRARRPWPSWAVSPTSATSRRTGCCGRSCNGGGPGGTWR